MLNMQFEETEILPKEVTWASKRFHLLFVQLTIKMVNNNIEMKIANFN